MRKSEIVKLKKVAKEQGWYVEIEGKEISFSISSPAGQDFNVYVSAVTLNELAQELYRWHEGFDCSEEAYLWLDETGHGKNGAPHDMKDLYEDMEWCGNEVEKLAEAMREVVWEGAK
jgi:hypothetical protein